jgi:CheY-like chemotaxis protein
MNNQTVGGSEPKKPHMVARAMAALAANASPLTTPATEPATRPKVAPAVSLHPEPSATLSPDDNQRSKPMSVADQQVTRNDELRAEVRKSSLEEVRPAMPPIRQALQSVAKNPSDILKLRELFDKVHDLAGNTSLTRLVTIGRVVNAFDRLIRQLVDKPDCLNQSVQRTMAQTVDLLSALFDGDGRDVDLAISRALAVDDQQIAMRFVMNALEKAGLKSQALSDPGAALSVAQEWQFDLIVLDIEMPGMTGVELCARLRALPNYKTTPVLFVTSATDFEHRADICRSGGSDLITKPFLATELGLKALALIVKSKTAASW